MRRIDLHVHSSCSDGTCSPSALVAYAQEKGLSAMALTDHDTVAGVQEAIEAAGGTGLKLIPGVELSAEYRGNDIHILGLYLNHRSGELLSYLEKFREIREERNQRMAQALTAHGMPVTEKELREEYTDAVLTRAHFAKMLVKKGCTGSYQEAFDRFLGDGKCCYIPKERISPPEAVELIHRAGGLAVLAHPLLYHMGLDQIGILVEQLKEQGLDGIEAIYSMNSGRDERHMRKLAQRYGLFITGGSDFHGGTKPNIDLGTGRGNLQISEELLSEMEAALERRAAGRSEG